MYSRELDGREVDFGVSGKLWNGVLVMFDRETGSFWTQLDGRAIQGERSGRRLEHRHSEFTTWEAWRAEHPETLVLAKTAEDAERTESHYADYHADPHRLYHEELADGLGGAQPKDVVFGVVVDGVPLAVTEDLLRRERIVNAVVGTTPIALTYAPDSRFVRALVRRLEQPDGTARVLLPVPEPGHDPRELFRDALTGEVRGHDELEALRVDRAFWYAWNRSHPASRVIAD